MEDVKLEIRQIRKYKSKKKLALSNSIFSHFVINTFKTTRSGTDTETIPIVSVGAIVEMISVKIIAV